MTPEVKFTVSGQDTFDQAEEEKRRSLVRRLAWLHSFATVLQILFAPGV